MRDGHGKEITISVPYTVYSVSLLYFGTLNDNHLLFAEQLVVSGIFPLTLEEAGARARKFREADWPTEQRGAITNWRYANVVCVQRSFSAER